MAGIVSTRSTLNPCNSFPACSVGWGNFN
jgi:hypothetical protein